MSVTTVTREQLREMQCLETLGDAQLDQLTSIASLERFTKGSYVQMEGETAYALFIVYKGSVEIEIKLPMEQKIAVYLVKPGDMFGWSAVVAPHTVTASTPCKEDSDLLVFQKDALLNLLERDRSLKASFMEMVTQVIRFRLKETRNQITFFLSGR